MQLQHIKSHFTQLKNSFKNCLTTSKNWSKMVKMAKMMWFNSSIFTGKNTGITTFRNKMSGQRSLLKHSRN